MPLHTEELVNKRECDLFEHSGIFMDKFIRTDLVGYSMKDSTSTQTSVLKCTSSASIQMLFPVASVPLLFFV